MPAERYFISQNFLLKEKLWLKDQEFHHLKNVMRSEEGDLVELVNGNGFLASAILLQIEKKQALLQIETLDHLPRPSTQLILVQAMPRINRLDFILEKGTELGMNAIWLFPGNRGERKQMTEHQLERTQAILISAMKQCGSLYLPTLELKPSLDKWSPPLGLSFFGDVNPLAPTFEKTWKSSPKSNPILFFIGPESGFSPEEESLLKNWGVQGIKLHSHILRTDTAALVALALTHQALLND
jgi:16S rRNA (uracil1498-N3)-methyltransferase